MPCRIAIFLLAQKLYYIRPLAREANITWRKSNITVLKEIKNAPFYTEYFVFLYVYKIKSLAVARLKIYFYCSHLQN